MPLSPIGYIVLPVGLVLFVYGRRPLMWATILCIPFHMMQVADVGVTTILAYQVFGTLFIFRCILDWMWSATVQIKVSWANILSWTFLAVCFVSIVMASFGAGTVDVITGGEGRWPNRFSNRVPLSLTLANFTQVLYPLFGVLLFYFLGRRLNGVNDLKSTINVLIWDFLILGGMSVLGGVLFTIGQGETYGELLSLFTVGPANIKPPELATFGQFFRTYTLAGEPGFTAVGYLLGLGVLAGLTLGIHPGQWNVRFPRLKLALLTVALLINGSTTGYFGAFLLVVWACMIPVYFSRTRSVRFRPIFVLVLSAVALLVGAGAVLQVAGVPFMEYLVDYHIAKFAGEAGSGSIRLQVTEYTLREVFLTSPLLGVGYGSHLSLSLASFLLSNVGLIGFSVFLAFLFVLFRNVSYVAKHASNDVGLIAFALVLTLPPYVGMLFVGKAVSGLNMGLTWLLFALAAVTYQVYKDRASHLQTSGAVYAGA